MFGLFTLVFWLSFLALLIGIISPGLISKDFSRKKVGKVFGLVCLVSIIGLIVFSSSDSSETISKKNPITPIQTNSVQDERIKDFFVQKFQESTKSTIQDFSIKNKVIFITLASKDNVELTAVDSAIALNRHPDVEFNKVILKNSVDQVSFDHALFDTYINNKIGDPKFIKQLEHSLVTPSYEFVDSKIEVEGNIRNKMDLYAYPGNLNLEELKKLCLDGKEKFQSGTFYFLVVFDEKVNASFPHNPFTAFYGIEEEPQKHIKAYCEFNILNGYSKLTHYNKNAWESVAKQEDI